MASYDVAITVHQSLLCGGDQTAKLCLAFQCYDTDSDGCLSKAGGLFRTITRPTLNHSLNFPLLRVSA